MPSRPGTLQGEFSALHDRLVAAIQAECPPPLAREADAIVAAVMMELEQAHHAAPAEPLAQLGHAAAVDELLCRRLALAPVPADDPSLSELHRLPDPQRRTVILHALGHNEDARRRLLGSAAGPTDALQRGLAALGQQPRALGRAPEAASPRADCPPPDAIWHAARTAGAERLPVIDHVGLCPVCAEAWRLAMALDDSREEPAEVIQLFPQGPPLRPEIASPTRGASAPGQALGLRAPGLPALRNLGLALLAVVGLAVVLGTVAILPTYRGDTSLLLAPEAAPELATGATHARDQALDLAWSPGPAGAFYALELTDTRGTPVLREPRLRSPRYRVPADVLARVEGDVVSWQVRLTTPEGDTARSAVYRVTLK